MGSIGLSELITKKEIKITELLELTIDSIEKLAPSLNEVIYRLYGQARITAYEFKLHMYSSNSNFTPGLMYGVPFLLKNLLTDFVKTPLSDGSKFVEGYISGVDSELVMRYKHAGLIICGRTSCNGI